MKILVACFDDVRFGGGGATSAREIAFGLRARRHDVAILSKPKNNAPDADADIDGIPVVFCSMDCGRLWRLPALVYERALATALRSMPHPPDGVLAVSPFCVNAARTVWPNTPVVYLFPCLLWRCLPLALAGKPMGVCDRLNRHLIGRCERRAIARADIVLVQAKSVAQDVTAFCPGVKEKLVLAPTGVRDLREEITAPAHQVRRELGIPDSARVLLAVGHLDSNKNVGHILNALALANRPNLYLWICGEGPDRDGLGHRARNAGIESKVRFLSWRGDMPSVYAAGDTLVHAARYDNFPNVYLEAMVCGLPVVGPRGQFPTTVSALGHVIREGVHGHTYDLASVAELVGLMHDMADTPHRWKAMGQAARELMLTDYSWQRCVTAAENAFLKSYSSENASDGRSHGDRREAVSPADTNRRRRA